MFRKFLIGLILLFCFSVLIACGQPPAEKQAAETKGTYDDLQKQVSKPVEKYESGLIMGKTEREKPEEGEVSAESKPEELLPTEAGEQAKPEEKPVEVEKEKAVPSNIDSETGQSYDDLIAEVETNKGKFKIKFHHDTAPKHVENFIKLVRSGFYDGLTFHRYVAGFIVQGGDPEGSGRGGPGYTIPAEISDKHTHTKGAVAAARTSDEVNPERESSGSQYYIVLDESRAAPLNGAYSVWGQVITGMDVVMQLRQGDKMLKITIRKKQ